MTVSVTLTYLDTGALMRRAEGQAANCTKRNFIIAPLVDALLDDPARKVALSEFTLVEFHTNVTTNWRSAALPDCDESWWNASIAHLLDRMASGDIEVLPMPPKAIEQAMALVTVATGRYGRKLKAWDALHYVVASQWGLAHSERVDFITSDSDFTATLEMVRGAGLINLINLDVLAHTGEGGDRGSSQTKV